MITINTKDQLIAALRADLTRRVAWRMGSRPAAPGFWELLEANGTRERISAAAAKALRTERRLHKVQSDFSFEIYRFFA